MNSLLLNPAVQSGVIPLIVALVCAWLLKRAGWYWSGLGFAVAYYTSVYFAAGFQFTPLTSTRKMLLLGIAAILLGLLFDYVRQKPRVIFPVIFVAAAAAVAWIIWPVASRQEGGEFWLMLLPSLLYAGWLTAGMERLNNLPDHGAMAALALGLGTGVSALLGASALLGQLGIAIGAVAGAYLLLLVFKQDIHLGSNFTLPVGLLSALIGIAAVVYASLPWYSLLPLLLIPATVNIPLPGELSKFFRLLLLAAYTLPLTIIAIIITWYVTSSNQSMYAL